MTALRRAAALIVAAALKAKTKGIAARSPGDFGPEHGIASKRVEIVDGADPDSPNRTIRRARVADPIARMRVRGEISQDAADAAAELRQLAEAAQYASRSSLGSLDRVGGGAPGAGMPPPSVARAAAKLARAYAAAWPFGPVLLWVVIENRTIGSFARDRGVKPTDVSLWLRAGLQALSTHFSPGNRHSS